MRVRLRYSRQGTSRFLSHLDMARLFLRALRRGQLPLAYSQGFNPQPRVAFAAPLPVGTAGLAEYVDIFFTEPLDRYRLMKTLNDQMPAGIEVQAARQVPEKEGSLMARVDTFVYQIHLPATGRVEAAGALEKLDSAPEAPVVRRTKKGPREKDIKPFIKRLELVEEEEPKGQKAAGAWHLELILSAGPEGSVRPEEVLAAMDIRADTALIVRKGVYIAEEDTLRTPFDVINGEVSF